MSGPVWSADASAEQRGKRERSHTCAVTFDRGRSVSKNPELDLGFNYNHALFGVFHNRPDLKPATGNVTAALMGDPAPDRVVPEIEEPPEWGEQGKRRPSPIYLTFKDLRRGMEEA